MELIVKRSPAIGVALPGEMFIDGIHASYTLERLGVEIPPDTYDITLYLSPHFGMLMPLIKVPGRSYILIHWGNYPYNSDGCILVGETQDPSTGDIFNSRKMWQELFPAIEEAVGRRDCILTIS